MVTPAWATRWALMSFALVIVGFAQVIEGGPIAFGHHTVLPSPIGDQGLDGLL
ncbi:hypothetical protein RRF56_04615 [Nodosilinea sp. E11]|nr:hypothetical protein RRF56_04615 [Nodosilinea sp. E11]